jgi:hypothetical protein
MMTPIRAAFSQLPNPIGSLAKLENAHTLLFDLLLPICPAPPVVGVSLASSGCKVLQFFLHGWILVVIPVFFPLDSGCDPGYQFFLFFFAPGWFCCSLRGDSAVTTLHRHQQVCCSHHLPGAPKQECFAL